MTAIFELSAEKRQDVGKGASRRLRRLNNQVPAIIYGAHKDPTNITLDHNKVKKALEHEAFYSHILTLDIAGTKEKVVLKDIQRHPAKPRIMHMDFQRISMTEKLHMHVPVHIEGAAVAPGVKAGGIVSHHMVSVEVTCLPAHLPEFITVDISKLALDGVVHLTDLKKPEGVEFTVLTHGEEYDQSVVSIHLPRAAVIEENAATTAAVPTVADTKAAADAKDKAKK